MRFSYCYKTSDGVRHEDVIESESRSEAFATLRSRKIRPIKVVSLEGTKANGEEKVVTRKSCVVVALAVGIVVGALSYFVSAHYDSRDRRVVETERQMRVILSEHEKCMSTEPISALGDLKRMKTLEGRAQMRRAIAAGYHEVGRARAALCGLFCMAYRDEAASRRGIDLVEEGKLPRSHVEVALGELYREGVGVLELSEVRHVKSESVFKMLESSQDRWHFDGDRVVADTEELNMALRNLRDDLPQ